VIGYYTGVSSLVLLRGDQVQQFLLTGKLQKVEQLQRLALSPQLLKKHSRVSLALLDLLGPQLPNLPPQRLIFLLDYVEVLFGLSAVFG
jgi:hypothetical protein